MTYMRIAALVAALAAAVLLAPGAGLLFGPPPAAEGAAPPHEGTPSGFVEAVRGERGPLVPQEINFNATGSVLRLPGARGSAPEWQEIGTTEDGFTVLMPGKPLVLSGGGETYLVSVFDPPGKPKGVGQAKETVYKLDLTRFGEFGGSKKEYDEMFRDKCADLTKAGKRKVLAKKTVKLGNHSGLEITVADEGKMISRHRVFIIHSRKLGVDVAYVFVLSVTSVEGHEIDVSSRGAQRFFDSFAVLVQPPINK